MTPHSLQDSVHLRRSSLIRPSRRSLLIAGAGLIASPAIVRAGSMTLLGVGGPTAAGGATTTLNPSDKAAGITLSGGNLTASNAAFVRNCVRAIASHSSGKFYYEVGITTNQSLDALGIANATETLSGVDVGSSINSCGWAWQTGGVTVNGASIGTATNDSTATGNFVACAVDLTAKLIWFRFSVSSGAGTNWNNSGTANPATGTGGFSIAGMAAGPYFPMLELVQTTDVYVANFGATAYALAAPAGFGNW